MLGLVEAEPVPAAAVAGVVMFCLLATSSVVVPVVAAAVAGTRADGPLDAARAWLARHSGTVGAAVLAVLGAVLIVNGLAGL